MPNNLSQTMGQLGCSLRDVLGMQANLLVRFCNPSPTQPFLLSESNIWKSRKQKRSYGTQARGRDGPVFSLAKEH